jgi:hypothetical protein
MASEELILMIVAGVVDLIKGLEGAPSQAQVEATIRDALVKASDLEMAREFPNDKP